ncbi:MAG: FecR domain-containing protein [Holophagales bacterium]|nr:FecR domain-containing protein [Holophagales bacterium]
MSERAPRPESGGADDERAVAELLHAAGPRAELPDSDIAAVAAVAREAWRFQVRRRRRRRLAAAAAIAALLLVAVALGFLRGGSEAPATLGEIAAVRGTLSRVAETGASALANVGEAVEPGTALETGATDGAAALALAGGSVSLRLDRGTRVRLVGAGEIELVRGAVYVDSGGRSERPASGLRIRTPLGTAADIGTQFSVRLLEAGPGALQVRVRTGEVAVAHARGKVVAAAAEELVVDADGAVARRAFAPDDDAWEWAIASAPQFDVEGKTLDEVLRWACRESGWTLSYTEPELRREAETIRVRGGLGSLEANQAPFAVLPGAGFDGEVEGSVLTVHRGR